jgi:ComF family protein
MGSGMDGGRHGWLSRCNDAILNSCLAQQCLLCDAPSNAEPVCTACAADLPRLPAHCPRCAQPSPRASVCGACLSAPPPFDRTVAAWEYAYPVDRLLQALKYHARLQLARWIGREFPALDITEAEVWIPVPLHKSRLAERGFNQSLEIARALAPAGALAVDGVHRVRPTAAQSSLPHDARARNIRGSFRCSMALAGRSVVVVDDVMTTGATLAELARVLKAAGASHVTNLVAARTLIER